MDISNKLLNAKKATQLVFLICGLGLSSWAPMVPFAKDRLLLDEADLGFLLLLLGMGAMIMMPVSGILMSKFGSRKVIFAGGVLTALTLPVLLVMPSYIGMAITLFIFGCGIGTVDVAMNAHGVQVQNLYGRPIMSSLHGLFSVGGLFGSLGLGFLMKIGLNPLHAAIVIAVLLLALLLSQYRDLFDHTTEKQAIQKFADKASQASSAKTFQWLNSSVLLIGFMCFAVFLSEGAMLDWSAVYLRDLKHITPAFAGAGYAAFSVAMATMRLTGDKIVEKLNSKIIVIAGALIAVIGLLIVIFSVWIPLVLLGFVLLGVGASNIVPIFFSEGGRIPGISPTVSIAAITTIGYAGQLAGPALLGYIAQHFSLEVAFGFIAFLLLVVAVIYAVRKKK